MNFQEAFTMTQIFTQNFPELFSNVNIHFAFGEGRPNIGDWSNAENIGILTANDDVGTKSGLYFFASLEEEILYIGKASKNNLHHRVWDHMKTPEIQSDQTRIFPKCGFTSRGHAQHINAMKEGQARLAVITVSDPDLVSLIEVYLHTVHIKKYGGLPILNKQIG